MRDSLFAWPRDHALDFILRSNSDQPRDSCVVLPLAHFVIGLLDPERLNRLVAENVVPVVGLRSADAFQGLFPIIGNDCSGLVVIADTLKEVIRLGCPAKLS